MNAGESIRQDYPPPENQRAELRERSREEAREESKTAKGLWEGGCIENAPGRVELSGV